MRLDDVPGDGWCFLSALVLCLNDAGVECMLDEVIIGVMEEITKNLDFIHILCPVTDYYYGQGLGLTICHSKKV